MLCTYSLSFQVETSLSKDSATASENSDIDAEYALTTSAEPHFPTKQSFKPIAASPKFQANCCFAKVSN